MVGRDGTWCDDNDVDCLFGLSRNARLTERRQLRRSPSRCVSTGEARFCDFRYRTRGSWSRTRRAVAKAEWRLRGARFVVTSLSRKPAGARVLYKKLYCARGENGQLHVGGRSQAPTLPRGGRTESGSGNLFADRTSTATLFANQAHLYFATFSSSRGVSETRLRRRRGRQGPGRAKFLKVAVCISVRRVPLSFSSTCDGTVRPGPGEPAGGGADVAPFAVPAAPPKAGSTGLVCSRSLPCVVVAVRNRERSSFVQERAHDSPAESGFRTADRPENRAGNPELASGSGEICGLKVLGLAWLRGFCRRYFSRTCRHGCPGFLGVQAEAAPGQALELRQPDIGEFQEAPWTAPLANSSRGRTAGAGPRRHARSLKARRCTVLRFRPLRPGQGGQVGGEAARGLADSGLGNSRTLGVPVFHCHAEATGHSAKHDPKSFYATPMERELHV